MVGPEAGEGGSGGDAGVGGGGGEEGKEHHGSEGEALRRKSLRSQQSAIPTLAPSETWGQFLPLLWP